MLKFKKITIFLQDDSSEEVSTTISGEKELRERALKTMSKKKQRYSNSESDWDEVLLIKLPGVSKKEIGINYFRNVFTPTHIEMMCMTNMSFLDIFDILWQRLWHFLQPVNSLIYLRHAYYFKDEKEKLHYNCWLVGFLNCFNV